jgi:PAS domain S-box-containing protein
VKASDPRNDRKVAEAAPASEEARLASLSRYEILDTPPEEAFDRITQLASTIFSVPIVLITLVDRDRQWFKSCYGLDTRETDRSLSFCAHAIQADTVMVVPDATQDTRFALNALVTGEPGIRFYAGAPLRTPDGYKLGTLCLIDREPRKQLALEQRSMLESLAALVVDELELRRVGRALQASEEKLQTSEGQLRAIVEGTPDALYIKDTTGRFIFINPAGAEMLGCDVDEVLGKHNSDLFNSNDSARITAADQQVMDSGESLFFEQTLQLSGEERSFLTNKFPYRSDQGDILGVIVTNRDITGRKRAQRELAASEARYRIVAETASDVLVTIDETSTILYLNRAAEKIFGHQLEDMLGQNLNMLMPEYLRHVHAAGLKRYTETGRRHLSWEAVEVPGLHKNGYEIDLEISFGEYKQEGRHLFTAIIRDITDRKRASEALERTTALLRAAFDSTAEGVLGVDEHGRVTNYNRRYLEMWRVPKGVLDAESDGALVRHALKQLKEPDGFLERVQEAYSNPEGETQDEFELLDGRMIERVSLPQRIEDRVIGRVWSFRDVTARHRAEERLQEANRELQARSEALTQAREEERRRLQRDLHDGLGPELGAQTLIVGSARRILETDPQGADQLLGKLERDVQGTLEQVRRLVYSLRPPDLDQLGLVGALPPKLKELVGEQLRLELVLPDPSLSYPAAIEVAAYRIVTEAVSNVLRHARARACKVELRVSETGLEIEIGDDGIGFDHQRPGVGLTAMRERAEELGGKFSVAPVLPGGLGVRVWASLPFRKPERRTGPRKEA